jgi:error-prone DNA polymerase
MVLDIAFNIGDLFAHALDCGYQDDTGMINVVVWNDLAVSQRRELLGSRLMEVHGRLGREGEVTHLVAARLADRSQL